MTPSSRARLWQRRDRQVFRNLWREINSLRRDLAEALAKNRHDGRACRAPWRRSTHKGGMAQGA